jgi:8-oxo-dGTP pyrophosphatase MutT (NUDIX family)
MARISCFTKRAHNLPHHSGEVSFPGGTIANGDANPTATAVLESHEEIGVVPHHIRVAGCLPPHQTRSGFRVFPIVGVVDSDAAVNANPAEVAAIFQIPLAFLLESQNYQQRQLPERSRDRVFNVVEFDGYIIWGMTTNILLDLRKVLVGR